MSEETVAASVFVDNAEAFMGGDNTSAIQELAKAIRALARAVEKLED
jgi:hypothetical protein